MCIKLIDFVNGCSKCIRYDIFLETFYEKGKKITDFFFFTVFYIFYKSGTKNFLIWFINK